MTLSKHLCLTAAFDIFNSISWLDITEESAIMNLIEKCRTEAELDVLKHTLKQMIVLNTQNCERFYQEIIDKVYTDWKLNLKETIFILCDGSDINQQYKQKSSYAHGPQIIHGLDYKLRENKQGYLRSCNSESSFQGFLTLDKRSYTDIILFDDFIGSGDTILSSIAQIKMIANNPDIRIHVISIACMKESVQLIQPQVYQLYSCLFLEKGLSSHYSGAELSNKIEAMKGIESSVGVTAKYSLGYKQCETLFGYISSLRTRGTPTSRIANNNFPILWFNRFTNIHTLFYRG